MNAFDLPQLPLGYSDFTCLRDDNCIYVDKTILISRLAQRNVKLFLARPRRFGKSLLVSTFESLFRYGLRDFQGLAMENLWKDKTYTVLHLDFSLAKDFQTLEGFLVLFGRMFFLALEKAGMDIEPPSSDPIDTFATLLSRQKDRSLVLLIDEYDAPLTAHLGNPVLFAQVRDRLSELYSAVKGYGSCLRFFFMTGITKLSNTSIFSAFNNLQDLSLDPFYGLLLGYTEEEIQKYFPSYLDDAARSLGISRSEVVARLRENYDGFSFDKEASTRVYCPWSVLNFLDRPYLGFQNYWYESAGLPSVLTKYLGNHKLAQPTSYDQPVFIPLSDLSASRQYDDISIESLLTQTGYLTIKELVNDDLVRLGYPNREVAVSMAKLYAEELLKGQYAPESGTSYLAQKMAKKSLDVVVGDFNLALNAIDYQRYPITDEAACRAYLQVLLIGASMLPSVENHSAMGRSDLEVRAGNRRWVFEIKYARDGENPQKLLDAALEQIRSRRYGETNDSKELIRVGLVFSPKERRFVAWQRAD